MRLGVLIVGLNGATANTFVASTKLLAARRIPPLGLVTSSPLFHALPDPAWEQVSFSGWDVTPESQLDRVRQLNIIPHELHGPIGEDLAAITPFPAVVCRHDTVEVRNSSYLKPPGSFREAVEAVQSDIEDFKSSNQTDLNIVVYLASPLAVHDLSACPRSEQDYADAMSLKSWEIPSAIVYCLAALQARCAFLDFTPNPTLELEYLQKRATEMRVPVAGRDGSTGQTLLKSIVAEMLSVRGLRLHGWYSANILGNNDGRILARREHATFKMKDKLGVLSPILGYDDFDHKVDISFYEPRGDNKESWDVVDFAGLMDLPMSLRLNWMGRDSPLAAAVLLDLTKLLVECFRRESWGIQPQLGLFFKNPIGSGSHGFFRQYLELLHWCGIDWRALP